MIFKPGLLERILAGKKTMTRRPVKPGELACELDLARTTTRFVAGCRYVPGRDYAVRAGKTAPGIGRIRITAVRLEHLGDITPQDAIAEGFKRTDEFFAHWQQLHGAVEREQWVWAISFDLVREMPARLLARDSSHGYTEKRALALGPDNTEHREVFEEPRTGLRRVLIEDEPEAVDEFTLERFATEARATGEVLRGEQKLKERSRSVARRVREEALRSGRAGVDVSPELAAIEEQLERMQHKRESGAAAA